MKYTLLFLDTETTGQHPDDRICQVAYSLDDEETIHTSLFDPGKKIPPEVSAVHHISNRDIADKPPFQKTDEWTYLHDMCRADTTVLVAHNAPFDIEMLKRDNIIPQHFICTLRVARHLDTNNTLTQYSLQYLRYYLDLNIQAQAHDAAGDVAVLRALFERLRKKTASAFSLDDKPEAQIEKMLELSQTPILIEKFPFGKYKEQLVAEIARKDPGYLTWLLEQKQQDTLPDEDWLHTLNHHLGLS